MHERHGVVLRGGNLGCRRHPVVDGARLNHELRRMILGPLRGSYPIELATAQTATR